MLSAAELAQIQSDAASAACDQTCVISRATTQTPDGYGTKAPTYTDIVTTVAGLSQPTAGQLQNYDFKIGSLAAWQVKLPIGTNVQEGDLLLIGGQTLKVHVLLNPRSYPALLTVLAAEVK